MIQKSNCKFHKTNNYWLMLYLFINWYFSLFYFGKSCIIRLLNVQSRYLWLQQSVKFLLAWNASLCSLENSTLYYQSDHNIHITLCVHSIQDYHSIFESISHNKERQIGLDIFVIGIASNCGWMNLSPNEDDECAYMCVFRYL